MKRVLLGIAAILVLMNVSWAQAPQPATFSGIAAMSGWSDNNFSDFGGSFSIGTQIVTDADRSLYTRVLYHRINVGSPSVESVDLSAIEYWYLGQKWSFYANPGLSIGVNGDGGNPIFLGLGLERNVFTVKDPSHKLPLSLYAFADCQVTEKWSQLTIGLRFTKPQ